MCPGDTTTLTAPVGALSYNWSSGAVTQSIAVTTAGNIQSDCLKWYLFLMRILL